MSDHVAAAFKNGGDHMAEDVQIGSTAANGTNGVHMHAATAIATDAIVKGVAGGRAIVGRARETVESGASNAPALRFWLVRASFTLFAVTILLVVALSALGLLSVAEAMAVLGPVVTLTAVIVGVSLGDAVR